MNYYNYLIISLIANLILLICLTSPNIVRLLHSRYLIWKEKYLIQTLLSDPRYADGFSRDNLPRYRYCGMYYILNEKLTNIVRTQPIEP